MTEFKVEKFVENVSRRSKFELFSRVKIPRKRTFSWSWLGVKSVNPSLFKSKFGGLASHYQCLWNVLDRKRTGDSEPLRWKIWAKTTCLFRNSQLTKLKCRLRIPGTPVFAPSRFLSLLVKATFRAQWSNLYIFKSWPHILCTSC